MKLRSIILCSLINLVLSDVSQKCCRPGQAIVEKNSTLLCDINPAIRIQSNFEINDFISGDSQGECVELFESKTAIFDKDQQGKITRRRNLEVDFFPKCCHLNHLYNQNLHSCQASTEDNSSKIVIPQNSFIFVGLPGCEIISDVLLSSLEEIKWSNSQVRFKADDRIFTEGKFCLDSTVSESSEFVVRVCETVEVCDKVRCVRKCCPDGQSFVNGSKCKDTFRYGMDLHNSKHFENPAAPFAIIHGIQKPIHFLTSKYVFTIEESGIFSIYSNKSGSYKHYKPFQPIYCLEHAYKKGKVNGYTFFGGSLPYQNKKFFTRWIKIISCIFLLLTMAVYLLLPTMLNLFGKILLSYSFATFLSFFFLCLSQFLYAQYSNVVCKTIGFLIILSSLWSYTWLNIMCIDIWASFGSPRTFSGPLQKNELKKLIQYSLYGWCLPMGWTIMIVLFDATTMLPEAIHPYVGFKKCLMENTSDRSGNYAYNMFLTLPISLLLIANVVLFAKTIFYCLKIRRSIKKMNETSKKNYRVGKEELHLVLNLAVIMGISFLFETISTLYDFSKTPVTSNIEVVWDTINCLQGVFIFVVFICKRKILNNLLVRLKIRKPSKYKITSSMATQDSIHSTSMKRDAISLR